MYYPACEGTPPGQAAQPDPYDRDVYSASDVPGLVLPAPSNCIDSTGNVIMNDSCVNANLAVQQQNFQRIARYNSDPAFAASFWPSNTPASSVPAASTPAAVSSPVSATPNRVTSSPLATVPSQTQTASPIPVSAAAVPGASVLTQPVVIGGASIPTWALIAGGLAVAYFMFGGKR